MTDRYLVLLAVIAGCRDRGPACQEVGAHVTELARVLSLGGDGDDEAMRRELGAVFASHCEDDGWSAAARTCIAEAEAYARLMRCVGELDDGEASALESELARRFGDRLVPAGERTAPKDAAIATGPPTLVVELDAHGAVQVGGRPMHTDELEPLFRAAAARTRDTHVLIRPARGTPHADVVRVMEAAKRAGLTKMAIAPESP